MIHICLKSSASLTQENREEGGYNSAEEMEPGSREMGTELTAAANRRNREMTSETRKKLFQLLLLKCDDNGDLWHGVLQEAAAFAGVIPRAVSRF